MLRRGAGLLTVAIALAAPAAAAAQTFDPQVEAQNYAKLQERKQHITLTPAFQTRLQQQNIDDIGEVELMLANDPARNPVLNICVHRKNECAGDVRFYDDWDGNFGLRTPVLFTGRSGATLSGNVWATREGTFPKPGIVITTGSVQAPETLYWGIAASLAKAGYVVITYDVQGQGRSDSFGEGADQQEGVPSQSGRPFYDGTVDATDFLLSTSSSPYVPRPSCTSGTSHAPKQANRVAAGLNAGFNPFGSMVDPSRIGIAGHSLGAGAVSFIGQRDDRVDAIVAWDNLSTATGAGTGQSGCQHALPDDDRGEKPLSPATASEFKPVMGMANDYGLTQSPFTSLPNPDARATAFDAFAAAGVDAMQLVTRGGSHFEYSFIPGNTVPDQLANATYRGMDMATWYTIAWFDKYVKGDTTADARLLTDRWCNDLPEKAVDNRSDGNMYSFYFHAKTNFARSAGGRAVIDDLRDECSAPSSQLAPDGGPVPFDQLAYASTPDSGTSPPTDTDSDGTPDASDSCPSVAGPAENAGCPVPPDSDDDGVPDAADACDSEPGPANNDGCPTPGDGDSDGVPDAADACPSSPGSPDNDGCPFPGDGDGDGVADSADVCPNENGPVSNNGCPLPGDRDGDGVPNASDTCPDDVGPQNNEGCPPPGDSDGDGVVNAADACPDTFGVASNEGCPAFGDRDEDDVVNAQDGCPGVPGPASNAGCPLPVTGGPTAGADGPCGNAARQRGTRGPDALTGTDGPDLLLGGRGRDRLTGFGGNDCLRGQRGRDNLDGGLGADFLSGSAGGDVIDGGPGSDSIRGGLGSDEIHAGDGERDLVRCGPGKDTVFEPDRVDRLRGCEFGASASP